MHKFTHKSLFSCAYCKSKNISERNLTSLGYQSYRCKSCKRVFNARTNTVFNHLEYPTDIVMMAVRWYLSYKLSYREVAQMLSDSGLQICHETIRLWIESFAPLITEKLRQKRKYKNEESHYVDETYVKIKGKWVYVYRAVDRKGMLVNTMVSETRDMKAARRFFRQVKKVAITPKRVTTDKHQSYPRAIDETLGKKVFHRVNAYLHNYTEQSHRPLKQRYYPMLGFGSIKGAKIFCTAFDELRSFFRIRSSKKFSAEQKRRIRASKIFSFNKMVVEL